MNATKTVHYTTLICIVILFVLSNLGGCGVQDKKSDAQLQALHPQAEALYQSENFSAAADVYLKLAELDPDNAIHHYLHATDALIQSNQLERARQTLGFLATEELSMLQTQLKNIYAARLLLAASKPDEASQRLDFIPDKNTPREVLAKFYATRSDILHLKKEYLAEVNERLKLSAYLHGDPETSKNYRQLWQALTALTSDELHQSRLSDATLDSWLELAIINNTLLKNATNLEAAITAWQQRYPDHPALHMITPSLILKSKKLSRKPSRVALLLPFTRYAPAAIAIREGFLAASYDDDDRPVIRLYDTDVGNVVEQYRTAIQEGADFIVGPLQKKAVSKLVETLDITVATLVLNQHEKQPNGLALSAPDTPPSLIQFSLSPEAEAEQVAERAWFDGHIRAIAITTDAPKGARINRAFTSHWQALGGTVLNTSMITPGDDDFNGLVVDLLNIKHSERRSNALRSRLRRNLKAETRRRQDIDLIFLAVSPETARQLIPQLRYHKINDITLYSTSIIYTGNKNAHADNDMNDVLFIDMPWVIDPVQEYSILHGNFEKYRKSSQVLHKKLYAFGIDAYHLMTHSTALHLQPTVPFAGKTGQITIDANGLVHRRLQWAKFVDGEPEPLDVQHR